MGGFPEEYDDEEVMSAEEMSRLTNSTENPMTQGVEVSSSMNISSGTSCPLTTVAKYKQTSGDVPYSYSLSQGKVDRRVSLSVVPKVAVKEQSLFANRVVKLLGGDENGKAYFPYVDDSGVHENTNKPFYAFLRNCLGNTGGVIFPYAPKIGFTHTVNYDSTELVHTNLSLHNYKNTPPPTINLKADFSADNRTNAIYMLSALWFFIAMTKTKFGDYDRECRGKDDGGLPPPVLYLNGYNSLIDNVPVVITQLNYDFPEDVDYVNVVMNLTQKDNLFQVEYNIENTDYKKSGPDSSIGVPESIKVLGNRASDNNSAIISVWLPIAMSIQLTLSVQPNLLKTRKQWSLDDFKTGALMLQTRKNFTPPSKINISQEGGKNEFKISVSDSPEFIPSGWTW